MQPVWWGTHSWQRMWRRTKRSVISRGSPTCPVPVLTLSGVELSDATRRGAANDAVNWCIFNPSRNIFALPRTLSIVAGNGWGTGRLSSTGQWCCDTFASTKRNESPSHRIFNHEYLRSQTIFCQTFVFTAPVFSINFSSSPPKLRFSSSFLLSSLCLLA